MQFFSDLKSGRCSGVIEARLLQFWEARNVKRGGELMWVDMLLVDLNHPRPTSQHCRQIPGPIQFHGGRKRRRRQRLELTGYSIDRRRWYRIEDAVDGMVTPATRQIDHVSLVSV
ncbi:hypothetical protein HID58_009341 [Brassica napus]|uniref:Uncharacterized protein n=2 Tax=Brassica napus TaxID=3708 RepID=A0ABQ8DS78_BRANA|nr:hypothetical protein HID58_009341 [Brassica napus]